MSLKSVPQDPSKRAPVMEVPLQPHSHSRLSPPPVMATLSADHLRASFERCGGPVDWSLTNNPIFPRKGSLSPHRTALTWGPRGLGPPCPPSRSGTTPFSIRHPIPSGRDPHRVLVRGWGIRGSEACELEMRPDKLRPGCLQVHRQHSGWSLAVGAAEAFGRIRS